MLNSPPPPPPTHTFSSASLCPTVIYYAVSVRFSFVSRQQWHAILCPYSNPLRFYGQSFAAAPLQVPSAALGYAQYIAESCTGKSAFSGAPAFNGGNVFPVYKSRTQTPSPAANTDSDTFAIGREAATGLRPAFMRKTP